MNTTVRFLRDAPTPPVVGSREWMIVRASWVLPEPDVTSMSEFTYNEQAAVHRQWHENYPRHGAAIECLSRQPFFGQQYMYGEPEPPRPPMDRLRIAQYGLLASVAAFIVCVAWIVAR